MAASPADIAALRRLVNEPTVAAGYDDTLLAAIIERYPLPYTDASGTTWYSGDAQWQARYDLNRAASDVWGEKAAAVSVQHDYSVDGSSRARSQLFEHYRALAESYRRKAAPVTVAVRRG